MGEQERTAVSASEEYLFNICLVPDHAICICLLIPGFSTGAEGRDEHGTVLVQSQSMTEDLDGIVRAGEW